MQPKPSAVGTLSTLTGGTLVALGFHPEKVDGATVHARITNGPVIYIGCRCGRAHRAWSACKRCS